MIRKTPLMTFTVLMNFLSLLKYVMNVCIKSAVRKNGSPTPNELNRYDERQQYPTRSREKTDRQHCPACLKTPGEGIRKSGSSSVSVP